MQENQGKKARLATCMKYKKGGILPKFVKRKKKIPDLRKEIYAKSAKMTFPIYLPNQWKRSSWPYKLSLGGNRLEGVLVDSGSTCNIIERETWEMLKEKKVKRTSKTSNNDPMSPSLLLVSWNSTFLTKINVVICVLLLFYSSPKCKQTLKNTCLG